MRIPLSALLIVCSFAAAHAQIPGISTVIPAGYAQFYVDASTGIDSGAPPNGTSPATPWKSITFGYNTAFAIAPTGAVVNVAEGFYGGGTGEVFPIMMHRKIVIQGRNAFTTIVDGAGSGAIAAFVFQDLNSAGNGPFLAADGPYITRLSILGFSCTSGTCSTSYAVSLGGDPSVSGVNVAPTLLTVVMFYNNVGVAGQSCAPSLLDCTIAWNNTSGLHKFISQTPNDCCSWLVFNSIVHQNALDLHNVGSTEIFFSDFSTVVVDPLALNCNIFAPCATTPVLGGTPTTACGGNVDANPRFVDPLGSGIPLPSGLYRFPDFRLDYSSLLRGYGAYSGAVWDGEGVGNPRALPYSISTTFSIGYDIGADQLDLLQLRPLAGGNDHASGTPVLKVGIDGEGMTFWMAGENGDVPYSLLRDYSVLPPPNLPLSFSPAILGLLWLAPYGGLSVPLTLTGPILASTPSTTPFPLSSSCSPGVFNPIIGSCFPYSSALPVWPRGTIQTLTSGVGPVYRFSNLQDMALVYFY